MTNQQIPSREYMNETVQDDRSLYREGWMLIEINRAEGWGKTTLFDTYQEAMNHHFIEDQVEFDVVRYRYLPEVSYD